MIFDKTVISGIFLLALFLLYSYLIFALADTFLENPKLKKIYRIPVGIFNTGLSLLLTFMKSSSSMLAYMLVLVVLCLEFALFYRDQFERIFFVVSAFVMHLMAIRAICVAIFAIYTGTSVYAVVNNSRTLLLSMGVTFVFLNLAIVIVLRFIPPGKVKLINQNREQLWFMIVWISVFNLYLLLNSKVYSVNESHSLLTENQYMAPLAIVIGLYIVLFFAFKMNQLLGYKEENQKLELAIFKEQQLRNSMISEAIATYEFNLNQDIMISECANCPNVMDDVDITYTQTVIFMAQKMIYADDVIPFIKYASPSNLIAEFESGKSESMFEYRRLKPDGQYIWVNAVTNFMRDVTTGDIKGFAYIKDINEKKKLQLELKYKAERDSLTGLYNKGTANKAISEYLLSSMGRDSTAALFIIDVDNFKAINDCLGHTFGDAVLCELGERLRKIFRSDDIVARVGGDEFMAFMKPTKNIDIVRAKALEICKAFKNTYESNDGLSHTVSSSIGISIFPLNGEVFEKLYEGADSALYSSKNRGKDTYTIYNGEVFTGYQSTRTAIDAKGAIPQKSFRENRLEYIFKILYGSENPIIAVKSALELLANHFSFSRGYIFETDVDEQTASNTFEWCADGISPQIDELQNVPMLAMERAIKSFYETGTFFVRDITSSPQVEREILEPQGIKSMLQFGVFENGKLVGFIGFDDCVRERIITDIEVDEIATLCNILATFIVKHRATKKVASNAVSMFEILNNLDSYAYVIDKTTYKVLFANNKTEAVTGSIPRDSRCYEKIRGHDTPCDDCPLSGLTNDTVSHFTKEIYNVQFKIWTETTVSYINWVDSKMACLINCIDITKYKEHYIDVSL